MCAAAFLARQRKHAGVLRDTSVNVVCPDAVVSVAGDTRRCCRRANVVAIGAFLFLGTARYFHETCNAFRPRLNSGWTK
jgi:hypothetical protein